MENDSRKKVIAKMFDAALKERLSQLASKYDPELLFEIWTRIVKAGGVMVCLGNGEWNQKMTIEQVLDCLDEDCIQIESLIRKLEGGDKVKKKRKN